MGHYLCHAHWMQPWGETREAITRRKSLAKDAPDDLPIGEFRYGITTETSKHGPGITVQGWVRGPCSVIGDAVVLEFRNPGNDIAVVRRDTLTETKPGMRTGYVAPVAAPKCVSCDQPTHGAERCPYCAHRRGLGMRGTEVVPPNGHPATLDQRIAATKLDSARADLDRPMREKGFGKMLDRDCYGQLFSAKGWETEEL